MAHSRRYSSYKPRSIRVAEKKTRQKVIIFLLVSIVGLYFFFMYFLPFMIQSLTIIKPKTTQTKSAKQDIAIAPPVLTIPFESTGSASLQIKGYADPNAQVEIYFDDSLKTVVNTSPEGNFTTDSLTLDLGTNNIYGVTLLNDKKSLQSKNIKVIYDNSKPTLEVNEPSDGKEIKGGDKKVNVSGKTDLNNSVSVNGSIVILNAEGGFSLDVPINEGENTITVTASNTVGNTTQIQRKVTYVNQ